MKLILILALIGYAAACTNLKRLLVKQQWADAFAQGSARETFGREFFDRIFQAKPGARALFSRVRGDNVYSPEFTAHANRVLGGVDMGISLLDDAGTLAAQTAHLKSQHDSRGLAADHYDTFRDHLFAEVAARSTKGVDQDAWMHCFSEFSPQ